MKRSRNSKRVTWASDLNLRQVRLFLSEDCPSKVGIHAQDHLQKKTSWMVHHLTDKEFGDLPPGFEGCYLNPLKKELSHIPRIEWKCPPKVVMSYGWHVAAGEESLEAEAQKLREMSVFEAVFPRHSAIPPSPSISLDVEEESYNDSLTPTIPLIPIEEGAVADVPSDLAAPLNTLSNPQLPALPKVLPKSAASNPGLESPANEKSKLGLLPDMGADLMTAASAAVTALMKSKENESLIDTTLLVKILSDPKMIEKLVNNHQAPINLTSASMPASKPITQLIHQSSTKASGPLATCANSYHLSSGMQSASKQVTKPTSPCHKSTMLSLPMPANESLQPPSGELQPTVTRLQPQLDVRPFPGLTRDAPFSLSRLQSINASIAKTGTVPHQVQSTVSSMPAQPGTKSFVEVKSNPVPATLGTMPIAANRNPVKDINYFKNLIREHGTEKHNNQNNGPRINQNLIRDYGENVRPKIQKACMFFTSPKGCRKGADCPYQHDLPLQFQSGNSLEVPNAKRMKLDREITGRTIEQSWLA